MRSSTIAIAVVLVVVVLCALAVLSIPRFGLHLPFHIFHFFHKLA